MNNSLHQYKIKSAKGEEINFSDYQGKVLLLVNTASKCGFTPQFAELEKLYQKYKDQGLVVIGFPSNEFAGQEPHSSEKAEEFCQINYGVSFPITEKIHVKKSPLQHDVFQYITNKKLNGKVNMAPLWNFQKYLIDKNGKVVDYFLTVTSPLSSKIDSAIKKLLLQ
ncbi:MAG: redoxin domain-containing protein [Chitinophagales bacterium]|nr:redoxin domain-containing protein [Chitinophagales bacterium]MCZ2392758.1 redoxin domain-containing protein [Chitinophagales bacterium]